MIELRITEAQLRRLVEGGVRDVLATHPEYFTPRGRRMVVNGTSKRVIGTIRSFAAQAAEGRGPQSDSAKEDDVNQRRVV